MAEKQRTDPESERDMADEDMARMLIAAGQRPQPSPEAVRSARAAVREEWRRIVAARARRRQWTALAAAASVATLAVAIWVIGPRGGPAPVIAEVVLASGPTATDAGFWSRARAAREGTAVHAGEEVSTGRGGRLALRLTEGASVRLDERTGVSLAAANRLALERGAVYVDASSAGAAPLEVLASTVTVRHLGTQYEVRSGAEQVQISVREGRVAVQRRDGEVFEAAAGERLLVPARSSVRRERIAPHDPQWDWAAARAPAFEIDGRRLPEFLAWAARELGRRIVYASPEARRVAEGIVLRGSAEDLAPAEALGAVLSTTGLRSREQADELLIELVAAR